jgi:O-antigen/teichoic acid export membrane protein
LLTFIIFKEKLSFDVVIWKKMIRYALPLLFFGLAGIVNQTIDRAMLRYLLPESVAEAQLGIYGACYKISIIMSLFIQAFRYAAEPFFFSKATLEDSRKLFAGVMNIFVLITGVIFLITMLFLDDLFILFVGSDFRGGVDVVPILLYAFMFLGISYNLSIWYKLTNRTMFGAWLATGGAVITVAINYWFIPQYAYMASAWATFISNAVIMIASFIIGQRYFTVPYNIQKILLYLVLPFVVYYFAVLLRFENGTYRILFRSFIFLAYLFLVYLIERKNLKILIKQ